MIMTKREIIIMLKNAMYYAKKNKQYWHARELRMTLDRIGA